MTDLKQRAERIAKKHGLWNPIYGSNESAGVLTSLKVVKEALEEMALEVWREAIEKCAPYMEHKRDCRVLRAWTDADKCDCGLEAIRALLPAAQEESEVSIPVGVCRWCLRPEHPSGTICRQDPMLRRFGCDGE